MPETQEKRLIRQGRQGVPIGGGGAILFGLPFLAAGIFITLLGLKLVPHDPSTVHAPYWVLTLVGLVFLSPGALFILTGLRGIRKARRAAFLNQMHPGEPWFADYPWDLTGISGQGWRPALRVMMSSLFVFIFLTVFNYLLFVQEADDAPFFAKAIILGFDIGLLVYMGWGLYLLVRYLKFGRNRLVFQRFPYHPGETLDVSFRNPRGIGPYSILKATLRFVEERIESSRGGGSGRHQNQQSVACYQLYAETRVIGRDDEHRAGSPDLPITFELPETGYATSLSHEPPRYWELELEAETPGVDFHTRFVLPVYAKNGQ